MSRELRLESEAPRWLRQSRLQDLAVHELLYRKFRRIGGSGGDGEANRAALSFGNSRARLVADRDVAVTFVAISTGAENGIETLEAAALRALVAAPAPP